MKGEGGASSSSFSSNVDDNGNRELSVLAVDDNLVDRKLIEKLLKTSFFKGTAMQATDFHNHAQIFAASNYKINDANVDVKTQKMNHTLFCAKWVIHAGKLWVRYGLDKV